MLVSEPRYWIIDIMLPNSLKVGTGLVGLIAAQAGASKVIISDYPVAEIQSTIQKNVQKNLSKNVWDRVLVQGHVWGNTEDDFSNSFANRFTRVLSADCLWLSGEHENLAHSMLHFLSLEEGARVWVTAGFHTGRATVAHFFEVAGSLGLMVEHIWERDVHGEERAWMTHSLNSMTNAADLNKWIVIATLRRANR